MWALTVMSLIVFAAGIVLIVDALIRRARWLERHDLTRDER